MRKWVVVLSTPLLAMVWMVIFSDGLEAVPIFARKYKMNCTTCHVIIPKLNAFGRAFLKNGYRLPQGDEGFVKVEPLQLGAPGWKKVFPRAVWPGEIHGLPPITGRILTDLNFRPRRDPAAGEGGKTDFDFPHELEIIAGGDMGEHLSFFAGLAFEKDGSGGIEPEVGRAFFQFNKIVKNSSLFNVKVGLVEIGVVPFSRFSRRITGSDFLSSEYIPSTTTGFTPGGTDITGGFRFMDRQAAIELWGMTNSRGGTGGFEWAFGANNGTGSGNDTNTSKDLYARISYKIGGMGVGGSVDAEEIVQSDNWVDNSVKIGLYAYDGKAFDFNAAPLVDNFENEFERLGIDIDWFIGDVNVYGTFWGGKDEVRNLTTNAVETVDSEAWFVQADWVIRPWVVALARYEEAKSEVGSVLTSEIERFVPGIALAIRPNMKVVTEAELYNRTISNDSGDTRYRMRWDFAF